MTKISAGSYDLNTWLFGGYDTDIITTIYGSSGTGKTNFCLLVAVSQAKKGHKVLYIDTEGGFSSERVKQLAGDQAEEVLKNILLLKPTNFIEQKEAFKELLRNVKKQVSLIIVDGMTMLYRLDFAEAKDKGVDQMQRINAELARQMRLLAETARKEDVPVIVTNQTYSWDDRERMVAGDVMKYWSKCLIELVNLNGKRTAYLRKHRSLGEKSFNFQLINEGIRKKGWI